MDAKSLTEHEHQVIFVRWLKDNGYLFYAIPNGGYRRAIEAIKLGREGVRAGVPDLHILLDKGRHLYIEMKKPGGKVSKVQKEFIDSILALGHPAMVAYGFHEARQILLDYESRSIDA